MRIHYLDATRSSQGDELIGLRVCASVVAARLQVGVPREAPFSILDGHCDQDPLGCLRKRCSNHSDPHRSPNATCGCASRRCSPSPSEIGHRVMKRMGTAGQQWPVDRRNDESRLVRVVEVGHTVSQNMERVRSGHMFEKSEHVILHAHSFTQAHPLPSHYGQLLRPPRFRPDPPLISCRSNRCKPAEPG
jgi:hypothetical protein